VAAGDNDLTRFLRSITNLTAGYGPGFVQAGQQTTGAGLGTMQAGLGTLQLPTDFYTKLLSGDPSTVTAALAPTAANIAQITSGAVDQASRGLPAGGYRAATLAGLPFAQASQVGNAALGLQQTAAQGLASIGQEQGQIGQAIGQLGTELTKEGLTTLQNAIDSLLRKAGINVQESTGLIGAIV
jgi:hypothetical protein